MKTSATTKTSDPQMMSWDTEFWGFPIGRATHPDVDQWAIENTVGLVCLLCDTSRPAEAQEAVRRGFSPMDVRVTLEAVTGPRGHECQPIEPGQIKPMVELARKSFGLTRFYADPRLSDERCDDLYGGWLLNTVANGEPVWVAGEAGFVTLKHGDGASELVLIAVEETFQGIGVGSALVRAAIAEAWRFGNDRIQVITQGRNIGALRTFESCGFRTVKTEIWFHKWYA